uniref:Protein NYNRIN-like n=1 Tax=Nicotiana tabacum TaxID=4097 RepID=A0A1S3WYY1_TOBAC
MVEGTEVVEDVYIHPPKEEEVFEEAREEDLPPSFSALLDKYVDVLEELKGLPPPTDCNHVIALIPEAQPFSLRPYRYFYDQKSAIEQIVGDMLQAQTLKGGFHWNNESIEAFEALKKAMTNALVLVLPDFNKPFVVEVDACGTCMGAVLMQDRRPIAFLSQMNSYEEDEEVTKIVCALIVDPVASTEVTLQQGILRFRGKAWI